LGGTATAAQVAAAGSAGQIQFNKTTLGAGSNLFWDNSTKRLGLGTSSPSVPFHLRTTGSGGFSQAVIDNGASGGATAYFGVSDSGNGAGGSKFLIGNTPTSGAALLTLDFINGNIGIGQTSPAKTLDVNGSANISRSVYTGINTVGFSATPNFDLNQGNTQIITLT